MKLCRVFLVLNLFMLSAYADDLNLPDLRTAATEGDMNAQFQLAAAYDFGHGVAQDQAEAAKWYRKAAEQGHAEAQNSLGSLYQAGQGVDQDYELAVRWYEAAIAQELPGAFNNLAYMYDLGLGVPEDDSRAASLYEKAAEGGEIKAMLNLGIMYAEGTGVTKDNGQAYMWLDLARFYTQRTKDMDLKWHIRRVMEHYTKAMTRKEKKSGKKLARDWDQAHSP